MRHPPAHVVGRTLARAVQAEVRVERQGKWLVVRLGEVHDILSWAVAGGGARRAATVAWYQVGRNELAPPVEARGFLEEKLAARGMAGAVGLMTGRRLDAYVDVERRLGPTAARCIATVGLSNALRVGDAPLAPPAVEADGRMDGGDQRAERIGTINLLCRVSSPLTPEALVEALALAAEARTLAVLELAAPSRASAGAATGTGTDCIVVAAPRGGERQGYAGKHTPLGHLIGAAVHEAVRRGGEAWRREFPQR